MKYGNENNKIVGFDKEITIKKTGTYSISLNTLNDGNTIEYHGYIPYSSREYAVSIIPSLETKKIILTKRKRMFFERFFYNTFLQKFGLKLDGFINKILFGKGE